MLRTRLLTMTMNLILAGTGGMLVHASTATAKTAAALPAANPFAAASTLAFQAPPFDKIKDADYQPAIEAGMHAQLAEMNTIAAQKDAPTFANTIEAMERTGQLLSRVGASFGMVTGANTNDALQKTQESLAPKLAEHQDAIYLNDKLYQRVKKIYDARQSSGLDAEQIHLTERYYQNFVRAGAQLGEADKTKLRALNKEESTLSTDFQNKLLAATNAGAVIVDSKEALAGFSDADIAAAADAAKTHMQAGKYAIVLQNTTQQPAQVNLKDRSVRERLFKSSTERSEHGDANDTRAIVQRLAVLRADRAKLLGFPNFAAYTLDDQMAKTPEAAEKLMTDMVPAATAKARSEAAEMQALIDKSGGGVKLSPWDWQYYAEQVRKDKYDLDESQVKPYFEIDRVLNDGVFYAANQLYGLTFKERKDLPVWQPDVRVYEVFDKDGSSMALFYADYWKRDSKRGGAWMDNLVGQSGLIGTKPVVYNICNFTKPAAGQPALITFGDVTTMFHEFGHALHGMLSNVKYPTMSGANTPRDFVEFPSQFNEHWASDPKVFANYAKHYQTGAPMPAALLEKIKKTRTFGQGFATTEYLAAALLDMAWHTLPPGSAKPDVDAFETKALKDFHVDMTEVPPRYRSSYFAHIWGGGYAAGYYAYLWSEVLDHDAFYWFREHGGLNRENGQRFRDMILSRGSTQDMASLYRAFRGRDPSVEPLLEQRGLKAGADDAGAKEPVVKKASGAAQ